MPPEPVSSNSGAVPPMLAGPIGADWLKAPVVFRLISPPADRPLSDPTVPILVVPTPPLNEMGPLAPLASMAIVPTELLWLKAILVPVTARLSAVMPMPIFSLTEAESTIVSDCVFTPVTVMGPAVTEPIFSATESASETEPPARPPISVLAARFVTALPVLVRLNVPPLVPESWFRNRLDAVMALPFIVSWLTVNAPLSSSPTVPLVTPLTDVIPLGAILLPVVTVVISRLLESAKTTEPAGVMPLSVLAARLPTRLETPVS